MLDSNATKPIPAGMFEQFFRGVGYPLQAFGFMRRHRLWGMATAAIVVNVLLLGILLGSTLYWGIPMLESFVASSVAWAGSSEVLLWLVTALKWIVWVLVVPAAMLLSFLLLVLVGQAVASPFLDILSEQVEQRVLNTPAEPNSIKRVISSIIIALGDLFWGVFLLVVVNIPLFLISWIPGVGTGVAAILSFSFSALLLAHEFVGLSLARNLVSYRQRWRTVWQNRWLALGMGTTVTVILFVPGLNLVLLPLAAVGGTLLYGDLKAAGRIVV